MHKFILGVFNFLKNLVYLFKLFFIFSTMMLTFYWIQNIIKADWSWLNFIKPFLDGLLNVANSIYSISFTFFGATLEFKYLSAVIILIRACVPDESYHNGDLPVGRFIQRWTFLVQKGRRSCDEQVFAR